MKKGIRNDWDKYDDKEVWIEKGNNTNDIAF
jgi:hypothetical protein